MPRTILIAALCLLPAAADAMVCRATPLVLRITLQETACTVGDDTALRRDADDRIECLLSNPQLRIISLFPDGRFTYADTDDDRLFSGVCTRE